MIFLVVALLSGSCAWGLLQNAPLHSANSYMDNVLSTALQYESRARSLDPNVVPDFETNFEDHMAIVGRVKGNVRYTEGKLYGLSKAKRVGECFGPMMIIDKVYINCTITLDQLSIEYVGKLKYGKLPTVSISAVGKMSPTEICVEVESFKRNPIPLIRNFRMTKIGDVGNVEFSGLGAPLNKQLKGFEEHFKKETFKIFVENIKQDFQYVLNQSFARVAFPW